MLAIRFQRIGRRNIVRYRLGVVESSRSVKSPFLEILASYNPAAKEGEKILNLKKDRLEHWIKSGAQLSEGAVRILKKEGHLPAVKA